VVCFALAASFVGAYCDTPLRAQETVPAQEKPSAAPQQEKVRAERYEIDVRFEPERGFLHAKARVTLRASQFVEAIEFELNPRLQILEVTDGQGRMLEFTRSGRIGSPKLLVRLVEPCGAEQGTTLTFVYEGTLVPRPMDYITKDGILLRDESRWYPAVDISAFTKNKILISVPSNWGAITSGQMLGSIGYGLGASFTWETARPVSSRSILGVPRITKGFQCSPKPVQEQGFQRIRMGSACAFDLGEESGSKIAAKAQNILEFYGKNIAQYGDSQLRIHQAFPGARGAIGYSAPGFLVVSEDVVKWHNYPGYAPEFLPHEVAHQWFPIEVTIAREEDGWLAESVAEYLAWRYLVEKDPAAARTMVARAMRDALAPVPLRPLSEGLRLFREGNEVAYPALYQRGMLVWRTLETVIDRERVDAALREYYKRYAGRSASIADFRKICEELSGRDLGWFFDYYINGMQIPEITIRRVAAGAPNEYAGEIVVKNVPADYQVRVEMRIETASGSVSHSVATRGEVTPFTVTVPGPVQRVVVDPDQRILRWTEAARRNRKQRELLAKADMVAYGSTPIQPDRTELVRAIHAYREAITEDPENLTGNNQQIRFVLGQLENRRGRLENASVEFRLAIALASLAPMETDFYRAWAHVYLAKIAQKRGDAAGARREAGAGLAMKSPALETLVAWPGSGGRETTAEQELRRLAR